MILSSRKTFLVTCLGLFLLFMQGSLLAHHSFAMFDHTRTITLKGSVTKFQWANPHAYLELDVPGSNGAAKHFSIELTSINMLQRAGWRSNMIKAGEHVTAIVAPMVNGDPAGLLLELTLANGTKLDPGVPAAGSFKRTPEQE